MKTILRGKIIAPTANIKEVGDLSNKSLNDAT